MAKGMSIGQFACLVFIIHLATKAEGTTTTPTPTPVQTTWGILPNTEIPKTTPFSTGPPSSPPSFSSTGQQPKTTLPFLATQPTPLFGSGNIGPVEEVCVPLKTIPTPAIFTSQNILATVSVTTFGACVKQCLVTSGCVGFAIEKTVKENVTPGNCVLGNSGTYRANTEYILYMSSLTESMELATDPPMSMNRRRFNADDDMF